MISGFTVGCRFLSSLQQSQSSIVVCRLALLCRAKVFFAYLWMLSVRRSFLSIACCLWLAASLLADDQRPAATDSSRLGTDLCFDRKGRPKACPESPPQTEDQKRATQKQDGEKEKTEPPSGVTPKAEERELQTAGRDLLRDQKWLWTSPLRLRENDLLWLLPVAAGTVVMIGSDTAIERHLPQGTSTINRSKTFSDFGVATFAGASAGAYFWGRFSANDHLRETGLLSAEAAVDSLVATEIIKPISGRQRPLEGNGQGHWFDGGASFPSEHSAAAWSVATVMAGQYPGWMTKLLAYGGAAAVSAARVTSFEHFTSDVVVGSALGWYMGNHVLGRATDNGERQREMARLGTFERSPETRESSRRTSKNMGSPYVPLDSWVYPAFDRLIAFGYVKSGFAGLRPWTRMECARLLAEAGEEMVLLPVPLAVGSGSPPPPYRAKEKERRESEAHSIYGALNVEFARERALLENGGRNLSAQVESAYTSVTGISGQPLTDGFHFGQTIINDFGRPYQEGVNNVTGMSGSATAGPVVFYMRGEYQYAPSAPAMPLAARQFIAQADLGLPILPPNSPVSATNRFEFLDSYAGLTVSNWELTFGRQSLWWGPGLGGPMLFSDNAEPIMMLRLNRVSPFKLPSILGWLGPIRVELFLGQLAGSQFVLSPSGLIGQWGHSLDPQPYINGQKFSFKPTPNFEFSVSRTSIYGGPGYPLTLDTLARSVFSGGNSLAGSPNKPGDRRSGVDFTYRIPKLRNWLTFYADGFTDDEFSPIAYPDRSAWRAGMYLARVPWVSKLDLRAEGVYTDNPIGGAVGPGFYYYDGTWRTGYRNAGNLIGSWIGRAGQGAQAWATYHFTPKNDVQVSFRHQKVSADWIQPPLPSAPNIGALEGGTLADFGVRADYWVRPRMSIAGSVQYEKWTFPVLAATQQSNIVTTVQLTYWPSQHSRD